MEIWLPDLPDVQLVQNYHRIPLNTITLDQLAGNRQCLRQHGVLASDIPAGALEPEAGLTRCRPDLYRAAVRRLPGHRLAGGDAELLPAPAVGHGSGSHQAAGAGLARWLRAAGIEEMVKVYQKQFGLDQPLLAQYLNYVRNVAHGDLNYSIANYPRTVISMISEALPWTDRPARPDHAVLLCRRHVPWVRCWPGRARRAGCNGSCRRCGRCTRSHSSCSASC